MKVALRAFWLFSLGSAVTLALLGLAFRMLIWESWEPHPGDPYGPSDLIDMLFVVLVFLLGGLSALFGTLLLIWPPRRPLMPLAGLAVVLAFHLLHGVVPTLRLW